MCGKTVKNIKFVALCVLSSSKYTKTRFRPCWGSLRLSPDPLVGSPYPFPLNAFGASPYRHHGASVVSPQHKFLATSMSHSYVYTCVIRLISVLFYSTSDEGKVKHTKCCTRRCTQLGVYNYTCILIPSKIPSCNSSASPWSHIAIAIAIL